MWTSLFVFCDMETALWLIYTVCSCSLRSFSGSLLRSIRAVCLGKSKLGIYYVPLINAEHFPLLFLCLFTFLFNPIGKSHRKLQVLKDSSTFKFCQDLPSTERFYPVLRQNLNQKLIRAKKKNVGGFGFLGFFLVRGLIWIFSRKLFLFHPL